MRLCACQECKSLRAIDPNSGAMFAGQYVTDEMYKDHRQRQNARTFGDAHTGPLLINPPLFRSANSASGRVPEDSGLSFSAVSRVFSPSEARPATNALTLDSMPASTSATAIMYQHQLKAIEKTLQSKNISTLLKEVPLVFSNPPTQTSPPMLSPSESLLRLEPTVAANAPVVHYERWLFSANENLEVWETLESDEALLPWGRGIQGRIQKEISDLEAGKMKQWERLRQSMTRLPRRVRVVNTVDRVSQDFANWPSKIVLAYLVVAFMHLIANVSLKYTKILLLALRWMHGGAAPGEMDLPKDVPTAISRLQLKPRTTAFVCCPKCFSIYTYNPQGPSFPRQCEYKRTPSSTVCGANLRHEDSANTHKHKLDKPVRLFLYHEIDDYISGLYSRGHIEKSLDEVNLEERISEEDVRDILGSPGFREFVGPEGDPQRPFLRRPGNEGRLAFSLNMDGFNPLMNKESGKKITVGAMYLVCLSLPPSIRYDIENIFLVGIIPGPNEPSKEEINHVLEPLVDDLLRLWHDGFYLTSTLAYPQGRLVRAAVIPLICDLPAARQMSGFAGFQSTHFCSYCTLKLVDIDNFDYKNWPTRTQQEHRDLADEWRSAPTEAVRDKIFEGSGIRWSQLLRLPYWDPTKHVMIDSMHGFFLRLFQRHCRQIWGMGVEIADSEYPSFSQDKDRPSDEAMEKGYKILRSGSERQLQGLKSAVLRELARLTESMPYGGRPKKLLRSLLQYRIDRGWFDEDGNVIKEVGQDEDADEVANEQDPELQTFLRREPASNAAKPKRGEPATEEEILLGLKVIETGYKSSVKKLRKPLLLKLCNIKGILVDNNDIVPVLVGKLEQWRIEQGITDASGNLIKATSNQPKQSKKGQGVLGKEMLREIRSDMGNLQLPSWVSPAPKHPGEAKVGKFTADQWRSFCFINITVTLNRLWGNEPEGSRKRLMLDNFMHLVTAVKLATMRTVTKDSISAYVYHIHKYLTGLLELYPGTAISPYQHLALHFQDFLLRFGPVHAWRCFPFERYNYLLQKIPTNTKIGELESTLLDHFCQGQRLHLLLKPEQGSLPADLDELLVEWEEILHTDIRGSRLGDALAFNQSFQQQADLEPGNNEIILPETWYRLLRSWVARSTPHKAGPISLTQFATTRKRVKRLGETYQVNHVSERDSRIYYRDDVGETAAGIIKGIFSHELGDPASYKTFFVVQPFKPLPPALQHLDPYRRFPVIGGRLYTLHLGSEVLIPVDDLLSHFAYISPELPYIEIPCVLALPLDK